MARKAAAFGVAILGLLSIAWGFWDVSQPYGPGEVAVSLHGIGLMIGLFAGAVLLAIAVWIALWHLIWVRRLGAVLAVGLVLFLGFGTWSVFGDQWLYERERRQAIDNGYAHLHEVSEATITALVTDQPDTADALALGERLRAAVYRDVFAGLMLSDLEYRRARRIWTLYLFVFLDERDPMRDRIVPIAADCAEFPTLFAQQYDPALHGARFADICG